MVRQNTSAKNLAQRQTVLTVLVRHPMNIIRVDVACYDFLAAKLPRPFSSSGIKFKFRYYIFLEVLIAVM